MATCCDNYPWYPFYTGGVFYGWDWNYNRPKSSNCPPSPTPPWTRAQQSPLVQVITQNDTVNIDMDTTFLSSALLNASVSGSVADVANVATFTTLTPHGLSSGQVVTVSGATHSYFNISAVITVTSSTTFTYAVAGGSANTDPGVVANYTTMIFCNIPNGTYQRQEKQIFVQGSELVTTATFVIAGTFAGGYTTLTFNSIAFSARLIWDGSAWQLVGGNALLA